MSLQDHTIDELEAFALGSRESFVAALVPGSAKHFTYASILSEQDEASAKALKPALDAWRSDRRGDATIRKFEQREVLASLDPARLDSADSKKALSTIGSAIGVSLYHNQQLPRFEQAAPAAPSTVCALTLWGPNHQACVRNTRVMYKRFWCILWYFVEYSSAFSWFQAGMWASAPVFRPGRASCVPQLLAARACSYPMRISNPPSC